MKFRSNFRLHVQSTCPAAIDKPEMDNGLTVIRNKRLLEKYLPVIVQIRIEANSAATGG